MGEDAMERERRYPTRSRDERLIEAAKRRLAAPPSIKPQAEPNADVLDFTWNQ
jgi:hypothetical protein